MLYKNENVARASMNNSPWSWLEDQNIPKTERHPLHPSTVKCDTVIAWFKLVLSSEPQGSLGSVITQRYSYFTSYEVSNPVTSDEWLLNCRTRFLNNGHFFGNEWQISVAGVTKVDKSI